LHQPVNANVLKEHTGIGDTIEFVVEPLGYNWYLADLIAKQTVDDICQPIFDFCLIDGAHEFEPDALAFFLVSKLLKPGGWVVLDDLNFALRSMSFWRETHGHLSDRELDAFQIGMVFDLAVRQHPHFTDFRVSENGRVGWARKKLSAVDQQDNILRSAQINSRKSSLKSMSAATERVGFESGRLTKRSSVSDRRRIHVLFEHSSDLRPHGCSHIRLLLPLGHPVNVDSFEVTRGTSYEKADIVIVERTWRPSDTHLDDAEQLVEKLRRDGARFIYSIDDNLLDLKLDEPARENLSMQQLMAIRYFIRKADGVIVTTNLLKDRLAPLNKKIAVVQNALDERLWRREPSSDVSEAKNRRRVIGYMGTHTHDADLMMIAQALVTVARKHPDPIELQFIGGFADSAVLAAFGDVPLKVLDVGRNVEYPAFARWMVDNVFWDFAVAPLVDNDFNRCKSDLKFLDYSALGVPGIYSNVPAYETVQHMETGYLSNNDTESWVEALQRLLSDHRLRQTLASNAREYVFSNRTLEHRAADWRRVILSFAAQQRPLSVSELDLSAP
jgi:glycosyltransferase involved in cell wall biosynthesis